MTSVEIASHLINHIVKQGKNILHDTYINKQKVPKFANTKSNGDYQQLILHSGFKAQKNTRFGYFKMKRDEIPNQVVKDNYVVKNTLMVNNNKIFRNSSANNTSIINKQSKRHKKSNKSIKSIGFNTFIQHEKQSQRLIKLQSQPQTQVAIRVKNKQQQFQNQMRSKQQLKRQHKNKETKQNQIFQQIRNNQFNQKKKQLTQHISKGQNYKYNYDDQGGIILYTPRDMNNDQKKNKFYVKQTMYKIQNQDNQQEQSKYSKRRHQRFKSHHQKNINSHKSFNQNQRIQSAKGLAFASSVLKTMNLSKISLNNTYQQFQPEHFMARNDLFNNNHSRQTSNIPYFQLKSGTVYTEVSTNQVVGSKHLSTAKTQLHTQQQQKTIDKLSKKFESFLQNGQKINFKTSRNEQYKQMQQRPIKTADNSKRKVPLTQRRPYSSINKGRIITRNSNLMIDLLQ